MGLPLTARVLVARGLRRGPHRKRIEPRKSKAHAPAGCPLPTERRNRKGRGSSRRRMKVSSQVTNEEQFIQRSMTALQHYTDRKGLEGIARTKTLWATDFLDLNDTTELVFGYVEMWLKAMRRVERDIKKQLGSTGSIYEADDRIVRQILEKHCRASFEGENGSEHLYVTSFVRPRSEDQKRRGLLTLWDRYTQMSGYCLEYDEDELKALVRHEFSRANYFLLSLSPVTYDIDEKEDEYQELEFQLMQLLLRDIERSQPNVGARSESQALWPPGIFSTRIMAYCARHKDEFFLDEREYRLMAIPAKETGDHIMEAGPVFRKPVKTTPSGRRHLELGADWAAGIEPHRIIVGPKAARDMDGIAGMFHRTPKVMLADFPVR